MMLAAVLWFAVRTIAVRVPYWGEAEVLFEARRIHEHLPLFVDPIAGAQDMGVPPSRWYVTYPPIWSGVLSIVPPAAAAIVGAPPPRSRGSARSSGSRPRHDDRRA